MGTARAAERPDVVLVTIDTLRADRLGAYGYVAAGEGGTITPNLDRLARQGRLFGDASAQVPITLPSHASILTGLDPTLHGVRNNGGAGLAQRHTTLAEILRDAGYATGAFVGAFPLDSSFGLDQGFEVYDDRMLAPDLARFLFAERPGSEVLAAALPWLRQKTGPRFLWLHFYDPHAPYHPQTTEHRLQPYDGEVVLVDRLIGELVAEIRDRPTVFVLTADHGEAFGEHGEWTHGVFLYQTTMHVPLILGLPQGPAGVSGQPVQSLDLLPTILDAVGLPARPELPGRSLLQDGAAPSGILMESLAALLDYGWHELYGLRQGRWKLVRAPRPEVFDLYADPGETKNLALDPGNTANPAAEPRQTKDLPPDGLAQQLESRIGVPASSPPAEASMDPEQAAALASLGYVAAGSGSSPPTAQRPDPKDKLETLLQFGRAAQLGPEGAIRIFEGILQVEPTNLLARQRLGWLHYFMGKPEPAGQQFQWLVQNGATATELILAWVDCQARTGHREDAVRTLQEYAPKADRPAFVYLNLGLHLKSLGRLEEAQAAWRQGQQYEPDLPALQKVLQTP